MVNYSGGQLLNYYFLGGFCMKKCMLAFFALATLITSLIILQLPAFAELEDTTLMVHDEFTADDNVWLKDYTGGTGFVNGWKASIDANFIATELPQDWKILSNQLTAQGETGWGKSLGQYLSITRQLSTSIDFSKDGEYYIRYRTLVSDVGTGCSHNLALVTDSNVSEYAFGYADSNGPYSFVGGNTPFGNKMSTKALQNGNWYTFVVQVSTRATGNDIVKVKAFKDGEEPTFSPNVWDYEYRNNRAYNVSRIALGLSNGTGSGEKPYFDEISIYKGSPVKVTQTSDIPNVISGQVLTVNIPGINTVTNDAQTFTNEWYDYTDATPLLLATGASYTVSDSMMGRLIRAKTVITDTVNSTTTTYWPISKYVRANADINMIKYNTGNNQVTATIEICKSGSEQGTKGSVLPILAKYDANNNLIGVVVGTQKSYDSVWQNETTSTSVQMNPCTLASGEYVRVFLWDSIAGVKPIPINKNSYQTTDRTPVN